MFVYNNAIEIESDLEKKTFKVISTDSKIVATEATYQKIIQSPSLFSDPPESYYFDPEERKEILRAAEEKGSHTEKVLIHTYQKKRQLPVIETVTYKNGLYYFNIEINTAQYCGHYFAHYDSSLDILFAFFYYPISSEALLEFYITLDQLAYIYKYPAYIWVVKNCEYLDYLQVNSVAYAMSQSNPLFHISKCTPSVRVSLPETYVKMQTAISFFGVHDVHYAKDIRSAVQLVNHLRKQEAKKNNNHLVSV